MEEGQPDSVTADDWHTFFSHNFGQREQRRNILLHWHRLKWPDPPSGPERVACVFERFLRTLLYEVPEFHLRSDSFLMREMNRLSGVVYGMGVPTMQPTRRVDGGTLTAPNTGLSGG